MIKRIILRAKTPEHLEKMIARADKEGAFNLRTTHEKHRKLPYVASGYKEVRYD